MLYCESVKYYYVYIITNYNNTTLYTGITANLTKRMNDHLNKAKTKSFSTKYNLVKLIYYEEHRSILTAISREKHIKGWRRSRKIDLIQKMNPDWDDLLDSSRGIPLKSPAE